VHRQDLPPAADDYVPAGRVVGFAVVQARAFDCSPAISYIVHSMGGCFHALYPDAHHRFYRAPKLSRACYILQFVVTTTPPTPHVVCWMGTPTEEWKASRYIVGRLGTPCSAHRRADPSCPAGSGRPN